MIGIAISPVNYRAVFIADTLNNTSSTRHIEITRGSHCYLADMYACLFAGRDTSLN